MKKRILFDLILLASVFCVPWWVSLVFMGFGVFRFKFFIEAILLGLLIDLLYGTVASFGFGVIGLAATIGIFVIMQSTKYAVRSQALSTRTS